MNHKVNLSDSQSFEEHRFKSDGFEIAKQQKVIGIASNFQNYPKSNKEILKELVKKLESATLDLDAAKV